jgi:hypothetical protein
LIATVQTPTSAALFDPYLSDFDAVLSDSTNPLRQSVIAILEISRPSMSAKAIQLFLGHLQDKANTALQTDAIAAGLLHAAPANQAIVHQVLSFVEKRSEYDLKFSALQEIGLSKIQLPEALDFIAKQLDDSAVRSGAMTAVSRLDPNVRARYASQLTRIALDPNEKADIRAQAEAAINGH